MQFFIFCATQKLSRKLVHILSGLLFLASWPIFRFGNTLHSAFSSVSSFKKLELMMAFALRLAPPRGLVISLQLCLV